MVDENYKRMFQDEDCTDAERELRAALCGQSVEDCRIEWSRQYKLDFILSKHAIIRCIQNLTDAIEVTVAPLYVVDMHVLCKCDNVSIDEIQLDHAYGKTIPLGGYPNFSPIKLPDIHMTFYRAELTDDEMKRIAEKVENQFEI